jgi:hypothetical protein
VSVTPRRVSWSPLAAVIDIGTSLMFSSRLLAVTMISPTVVPADGAARAPEVGCAAGMAPGGVAAPLAGGGAASSALADAHVARIASDVAANRLALS